MSQASRESWAYRASVRNPKLFVYMRWFEVIQAALHGIIPQDKARFTPFTDQQDLSAARFQWVFKGASEKLCAGIDLEVRPDEMPGTTTLLVRLNGYIMDSDSHQSLWQEVLWVGDIELTDLVADRSYCALKGTLSDQIIAAQDRVLAESRVLLERK